MKLILCVLLNPLPMHLRSAGVSTTLANFTLPDNLSISGKKSLTAASPHARLQLYCPGGYAMYWPSFLVACEEVPALCFLFILKPTPEKRLISYERGTLVRSFLLSQTRPARRKPPKGPHKNLPETHLINNTLQPSGKAFVSHLDGHRTRPIPSNFCVTSYMGHRHIRPHTDLEPYRGTSPMRKRPPPEPPTQFPRHRPTVGS